MRHQMVTTLSDDLHFCLSGTQIIPQGTRLTFPAHTLSDLYFQCINLAMNRPFDRALFLAQGFRNMPLVDLYSFSSHFTYNRDPIITTRELHRYI
jgi:hypothetical protein